MAIAGLSLFVSIGIAYIKGLEYCGPYLIAMFIALGFGFRGFESLKGYSYSTMIFAAVTTALYYPDNFIEFNGFKLSGLITPLLQLIMFGMGSSMSANDFVLGQFLLVWLHSLLLCHHLASRWQASVDFLLRLPRVLS